MDDFTEGRKIDDHHIRFENQDNNKNVNIESKNIKTINKDDVLEYNHDLVEDDVESNKSDDDKNDI